MLRRLSAWLVFAMSFLLVASPARAAWYEASSDNFVIYADADEEEVRLYAENLERYHSALEDFTQRDVAAPSPSNRITVYAVGSEAKVRNLAGSTGVAGFYLPRAEGSVAFVQDIDNKEGYPDVSTVVLLHEYAHHFLSQLDRFARPLWMNEGAAEFFANAYFGPDGAVYLGAPSRSRSFTIFWKEDEMTSVRELLSADWGRLSGWNAKTKDSFYGRSWILYHYLTMNEERQGQLRDYWLEVLKGTPSLEAGQKVFGDLGVLERQLNRYFRDRNRKGHKVEAERIAISPVSLRALTDAEVATMDQRIRLARSVGAEDAAGISADLASIADRNGDDARVWALLAKARMESGEDKAAIQAADRALSLDPENADALMTKGLAAFRIARSITDPSDREAAYGKAMEPLDALHAMEPNHTVPLIYTYRAQAEQGLRPDEAAQAAYFRAAELAPFDQELWLVTGMIHMNEGRIADALAALQPVASNPHGGEKVEQVRQLIAFLAGKPEGEPIPVQDAISAYFIDE